MQSKTEYDHVCKRRSSRFKVLSIDLLLLRAEVCVSTISCWLYSGNLQLKRHAQIIHTNKYVVEITQCKSYECVMCKKLNRALQMLV